MEFWERKREWLEFREGKREWWCWGLKKEREDGKGLRFMSSSICMGFLSYLSLPLWEKERGFVYQTRSLERSVLFMSSR